MKDTIVQMMGDSIGRTHNCKWVNLRKQASGKCVFGFICESLYCSDACGMLKADVFSLI